MPAIDLRSGRVVRLAQGDYARQTTYANEPLVLALQHADAGARWLHLVDLDAARDGGYALLPLLHALARRGRLHVQTGGGVRSGDDVQRLLDAGAARVVVGSVAIREPRRVAGWLQRFGADALVIALDARRDPDGVWRLPTHGWTRDAGDTLDTLLAHYADAGARHLLCTDIGRDGMLSGPNIELYRTLCARWPQFALIASGGVRNVADVTAARSAGCAGVVLGRSLLEGRLTLADALEAAC
ncbi:1-(5-phosphoribosyl)-5-[(5-phosphoribosylamino)methylideneamino]imidazole-4-carboxamide isomerase [Luteimonas sp. e5]